MKTILIGLITLSAFFANAQFPVKTPMSVDELFTNEADLFPNVPITTSATSTTSGTNIQLRRITFPAGFVTRFSRLVIKSTVGFAINTSPSLSVAMKGYYASSNDKASYNLFGSVPNGGGTLTIDFNPNTLWHENGFIQINIILSENAPSGYTVSTFLEGGQVITSTLANRDAKYVFLNIGDSISWTAMGNVGGGSVPNFGATHYSARIESKLIAAGISIRRSQRGFGASTAATWAQAVRGGFLDPTPINLVTVGLGTNDAANGVASATSYSANIQEILDYLFLRNPNASVILLGPPSTDLPPRSTNLQSYHDVLIALTTDVKYEGKDLRYYDCRTDFSIIVSNYTETTLGTLTHPRGDTGHAIIANGLWPVVQMTKFYINRHN